MKFPKTKIKNSETQFENAKTQFENAKTQFTGDPLAWTGRAMRSKKSPGMCFGLSIHSIKEIPLRIVS